MKTSFDTEFPLSAFADTVKPVTDHWLKGLHEMSLDLQSGKITPGQWQTKIADVKVELHVASSAAHTNHK